MTTTKTDAARFQNALRIMYSLDEVDTVLSGSRLRDFHTDPLQAAFRMDADTWAMVYALIEARQ